jgi:O-antigen/teichoic acid export membrane protein
VGNLKTKFLYQLIASFLHALIPLLTFPYIARVLGPDKLGIVNFIDYTSQIFITIASFGIPLYAVREVAKNRDNPKLLQKTVSELLTIHIIVTIVSIVAFLITLQLSNRIENEYDLVLLASLNILFNAFAFDWFIHGLEDFKTLSLRSLLVKVTVTILLFSFIQKEQDYLRYYIILVGGSLMLILYDLFYVKSKSLSISTSINIKKHFKPLFIFFLTSASISIYTLLDTFFLGVLTTSLAVGLYTTVLKIIRLSQNLINDIGGVLLPRISYLIEIKETNEISRIINKSTLYVFTVAIPLGMLFFLLAPEIILVLAGSKYEQAITTLQILSVLPLVIGLSNIFGIQVLIPYRQEKQLLKAVITGSIVSIILCLIFCPLYKEDGAAIATVIAEVIVTIVLGVFANNNIQFRFPIKSLFTICITALCFIPVIFVIRLLSANNLTVLIISLACCLVSYFFIQLYVF